MAKIIRFEVDGIKRFGELRGTTVHPLEGEMGSFRPSMDDPLQFANIKLLAPTVPRQIVAVGPNYHAHLGGNPPPARPYYWIKPASTLLDPEGVIELPTGVPMVCHESEMAIVIGKITKGIDAANGRGCIFGYTCINDVTAGKLTEPAEFVNSQFFVDGKIFDTFGPLGPLIETELNVADLKVECRVNGKVRQSHRTTDFIFPPIELVALVSSVLTLYPGDVIATGSPPGMGPLLDGDVVEVEVENIGILRNHVRNRSWGQARP